MLDFRNKLPSFWTIQSIGWLVYFVVIYVTLLTVAPPENFLTLFFFKGFRALTGFILTSFLLRSIYKRFGDHLSISRLVLLALICSVIAGAIWTSIEFIYVSLTNAALDTPGYLARSPRIALDYVVTLAAWSAFYLGVKNWLAWQMERENALQSAALAQKAQLDMLRYQLNPHFLFNALNSIRASVNEDGDQAREMITQLSEFLRHSLVGAESKEVPLGEEMEAARNYLAIEKVRFEDNLAVEYEIEKAAEEFTLPCFLLNPLIENAIKHGVRVDPNVLKIKISAKVTDRDLVLQVANTGKLSELQASNGTKIGLKNVRERLEKTFGKKGSFDIRQDGEFVVARIEISKA